jgi:hypothetical protein
MGLLDFFINIGIKADTLKLRDLVSTIGELNLKSVFTAVGLGAMYEGLTKVMSVGDKTATTFLNFTAQTGLANKEMQQFAKLAEQFGSSQEDAINSVEELQMKVFTLMKSGDAGVTEASNIFGLKLSRADIETPMRLMDLLHDRMRDPNFLTPMKKLELANLGVSASLMRLLEQEDKIYYSRNKMPFTSPEDLEKINQYHIAWTKLTQTFQTAETILSGRFAPTLQKISELFLGDSQDVDKMSEHLNKFLDSLEKKMWILAGVLALGGIGITAGAAAAEEGVLSTILTKIGSKTLGAASSAAVGTGIFSFLSHGDKLMDIFSNKNISTTPSTSQVSMTNHVTVVAKTDASPIDIANSVTRVLEDKLLEAQNQKSSPGSR